MEIFETPEQPLTPIEPVLRGPKPLDPPEFMKKGMREETQMDIAKLRSELVPTDDMARKIEADSDPVGGIHGLKAILKKSNHYKGKVDGSIDEEKKPSSTPRVNPLVKALMDFQIGYNSPYLMGNDGKLMYKSQTEADYRQGVPREEIGKLGPVTLVALLDFAKRNGIDLPPGRGDKKFESAGEFIQKYGPMVDYLTDKLSLPKNLILGIAKQESDLGTNPASYWGGNGVLQLTSWPLRDMAGETQRKGVTDWRKVGIYQNLFRRVETDELKGLPFGSIMSTLEASLDADAWSVLDTVCGDDTTPKDFQSAMQKIKSWERGKYNGLTFHTVNILVGSIYLSYLNTYRLKGSGNVGEIAKMYNGSEHKAEYAQAVTQHVKSFTIAGRPGLKPTSRPTRLADNSDSEESTTDVA